MRFADMAKEAGLPRKPFYLVRDFHRDRVAGVHRVRLHGERRSA